MQNPVTGCSVIPIFSASFIPSVKSFIGVHASIIVKPIIVVTNFYDTICQKNTILYIEPVSILLNPTTTCYICCNSFFITVISFIIISYDTILVKPTISIEIILFSIYCMNTGICFSIFSIIIPIVGIRIPYIYIKTSIFFCPIRITRSITIASIERLIHI